MALSLLKSWRMSENEIIAVTDNGVLGISFAADDIIRIRIDRQEPIKTEETFIVDPLPAAQRFATIENAAAVTLRSGTVTVDVMKSPVGFVVRKNNVPLCATPASNFLSFEGSTTTLRIGLTPDERIVGLGQDPMARINQRGCERWMWNEWGGWRRSGNMGVPFYISSRGYALLLNSSWASRFACGGGAIAEKAPEWSCVWAPPPWPRDANCGETNPDVLSIVLENGIMDVCIICRESVDAALEAYADLTGHAPMPPKWALGFIQCKNRYRSQAELLAIAREYRRRKIPCDVLVIDWLWFRHFGDLAWFKNDWPDPKGMCEELASMGITVMQAQHPFIDKKSLLYERFKKQGFVFDISAERAAFDHSSAAARDAWWAEVRRLYQDGIRGYWTDMGELENDPPGGTTSIGPRERAHNLYTTLWTKGLYEHQRAEFGTRVFSLARSGFAGTPRWGAALWSNDIDASWEVLADQVKIGQGVALSGQQYWCTDIGGFSTNHRFSAELYLRWFQWGTFCPIFRTHGTRPLNEAWTLGTECESIIRQFIELRYRLLPYIYSCCRRVTEKGTPIMRAMLVDFPDDPAAVAAEDQFMFGPAFLVAPVTERGKRIRTVYLPKGIWYDFWTERKFIGPCNIEAAAPLSRIPLFVRGGSIIPMEPTARLHTGEKLAGPVDVHVYPGCEGSFELYDDDGVSFKYETGEFLKTKFVLDADGTVAIEDGTSLKPVPSHYNVIRHDGQGGRTPHPRITVDCDLASDGWLTVHALLINESDEELAVRSRLQLPSSWRIKDYTQANYDVTVRQMKVLTWEAQPIADALPLRFEAPLEFALGPKEKEERIVHTVQWGSGWSTRWMVAGCFDNSDGTGIGRPTPVENDMHAPSYVENGHTIQWLRNKLYDFNSWGYVDCRWSLSYDSVGEKSQGIAYAKCRLWSPDNRKVKAEVAGDRSIRVMVNGDIIFESNEIIILPVLTPMFELRKGWNDVLIKVALKIDVHAYTGRELGFMFRVVNENNAEMNDVLYAP